MEMLGTARSIQAVQPAPGRAVTEAQVDELSRRNFLDHIPLSNATNIVPFVLIAICSAYLPDWRLIASLLGLNVLVLVVMYRVSRMLQAEHEESRAGLLWRVYEGLAFVSGLLWAGKMYPVVATLGRDIASMFVCVVIIVSIAVTSMVVASQWRTFLCFLAGVMLCLVPQTVSHIAIIGPVPLLATLGLAPALISLAIAIRRQNRLMIRTQLEKQQLADDLAHALAVAEYLASRDSLTDLYNRRAFVEVANRIGNDAGAAPLSLIIVDLDHFKRINDEFGHGIGDSVLKMTAQLISNTVGPFDVVGRGDGAVARWGGEEFIVLLRNCPLDTAAALAERLRVGLTCLRGMDWPDGLVVSGSFGVARWHSGADLNLGIGQADAAMYQAKNGGRNRVCVYQEDAVAVAVALG
ncbi:GGDEF domain-containing protein [Sphingomonas lacunae]|uniref:diguanylate cyclase n=1 Tax=Sphingomonas lacunae TaxID=2698828 RepID=A0A6M4AXP6_9SPHN|nr:GGDEF domain-containing protein [Sphingomonas lacunae]QJQ33140.1 GGDEF domain-containing protein [Sphingomonas lacunae]